MAASVRIDFQIGGADKVDGMFRSVAKSAELAAKAQIKSALQAQKAQERALLETQKAAAKAALETSKINQKAAIAAAVSASREKIAADRQILKSNQEVLRAHLKRTEIQMKLDAKAASESARMHDRAERDKLRSTERRNAQEARLARQEDAKQRRQEEQQIKERRASFGGYLSSAGRGAVTGVRAAASAARYAATNVAEGMGVDIGVGSSLRRRTDKSADAIDLVNSATQGNGEKTAAMRVAESKDLIKQADAVAMKYGRSSGAIIKAGQGYVAATGDLEGFRKEMEFIAMTANTTGAPVEELGTVMGRLATKMPKGEARDMLRVIAGHGKVGSIELKDMIAGVPQLGGLGGLFGGPRSKAVGDLSSLAQIAIEKGTSSDPAEAFTATRAFVNTMSKRARRKDFKKLGIDIEDDKQNLLSPEEILVNTMRATKGDKVKVFSQAFQDTRSHAVVHAARNAYLEAESKQKGSGEDAIRAMFAKYKAAVLTPGEEKQANEARMQTDASKAARAQERFDALVSKMADSVIPAFERMAPAAEKVANAMAGLVDTAANHPWGAVAAVITASMVREIAAAKIGDAIKGAISGQGAGAAGGGTAGAAIAGAGIGLAIGTAAAMGADKGLNAKQANADAWTTYGLNALGSGNRDAQAEALVQMEAEQSKKGGIRSFLGNAWGGLTAGYRGLANGDITAGNLASAIPVAALGRAAVEGVVGTQQDAQSARDMQGTIDALKAEISKPTKIDGTVTVTVANIGEFPKPGPDPRSNPIVGP